MKKNNNYHLGMRITLMTALCIVLYSCDHKPTEKKINSDLAVQLYEKEVAAAARQLINLTPTDLRDSLVYSFDSDNRFEGRVTEQTPSFCAVLTWCLPGWGLQVGDMSQDQLQAMHQLLDLSLSPGGYHTLLAVLNRQRIIGEMEEAGDIESVQKAIQEHPHTHANTIFDFEQTREDILFYPTIGGGSPSDTGGYVNWYWNAPGLQRRKEQFDQTSFAIFGDPGEGNEWGFRFEGHHITINMTFLRDIETGAVRVHATPLFFGTFPMIIPASPYDEKEFSHQWNWEKGQVMMYSVTQHLKQFWLSVPEGLKKEAFIASNHFPQAAPIEMKTPLSFMISSLDPKVNLDKIKNYPHIEIQTDDLSDEALWNLKQVYLYYTSAMNPNISNSYVIRIDEALSPGHSLTLSWAGNIEEIGSPHYSYVVIGDLLIEFLQSNQFLVQHDPDVTGNHLHSMIRDLSFDWVDPMSRHHQISHVETSQ